MTANGEIRRRRRVHVTAIGLQSPLSTPCAPGVETDAAGPEGRVMAGAAVKEGIIPGVPIGRQRYKLRCVRRSKTKACVRLRSASSVNRAGAELCREGRSDVGNAAGGCAPGGSPPHESVLARGARVHGRAQDFAFHAAVDELSLIVREREHEEAGASTSAQAAQYGIHPKRRTIDPWRRAFEFAVRSIPFALRSASSSGFFMPLNSRLASSTSC